MTANGTPWEWSPQTQRLTDVVLGRFDRSAAAERIVELERHVFRLQAAVSGERRSRHWTGAARLSREVCPWWKEAVWSGSR
jgi:hypothetical protein